MTCAERWTRSSTKRCVIDLAEMTDNIVKQSDVLKAIVGAVTKEFNCPVYSDEVREEFKKPCFFLAASSTMTPHTVNLIRKELAVKLTYYGKDNAKNELAYMAVIDRIQHLFQVGFYAGQRYLHIDSIEDDRAGEEQDILTITITINYVERVTHVINLDTIEGVDIEYTTGGEHEEKELWHQSIQEE